MNYHFSEAKNENKKKKQSNVIKIDAIILLDYKQANITMVIAVYFQNNYRYVKKIIFYINLSHLFLTVFIAIAVEGFKAEEKLGQRNKEDNE